MTIHRSEKAASCRLRQNMAYVHGDPDNPTKANWSSRKPRSSTCRRTKAATRPCRCSGSKPKSYQNFTEFKTRDIVLLASESTADRCQEAPHWSFVVDVTVENSKTAPPGTGCCRTLAGADGPSTMSVDPRAGEKYPRGNYCKRGARFGVHSSEENFRNPYYGKLTFPCLLHRGRARCGTSASRKRRLKSRSMCRNPMPTPTRTAT